MTFSVEQVGGQLGWIVLVLIHLAWLVQWLFAWRKQQRQVDALLNAQYQKLAEQNRRISEQNQRISEQNKRFKKHHERTERWVIDCMKQNSLLSIQLDTIGARRAFLSVFFANDWTAYADYTTLAVERGLRHLNRETTKDGEEYLTFREPRYTLESLKEIAGLPTNIKSVDLPLSAALKNVGWTKSKDRLDGKRMNVWHPPAELVARVERAKPAIIEKAKTENFKK